MLPVRSAAFAAIAGLFCLGVAQDPHGLFKKPMPKEEEDLKFHRPYVKGMDAATRRRAYEQRLRMDRESPFTAIKWRSVGPERQGGRVISIAVPENNPKQTFVAFATGGLWLTEDDGITWKSLFDNQGAYGIGQIAVSRDGKTVWVGTGENNSQRTSYAGDGIYKSVDGGKSWTRMGLEESHHIGRIVIDPKDENTVYVSVLGHLYSQNPERGLYKTTDGGRTWQHALKIDERTGVIDLVMDPSNNRVLYASTWDRDRRAWNVREGGGGTAIYKSVDAGRTWQKLTNGLPDTKDMGRIGLAISPKAPNRIYALLDNQAADDDWIYGDERAPSGTLTLRRFALLTDEMLLQVSEEELKRFFGRYPTGMTVDALMEQVKNKKLTVKMIVELIEKTDPTAFESGRILSQVYRSDDAGKTWRKAHEGNIGPFGGYYWQMAFASPHNPDDVWICGVPLKRSLDGGKTWKDIADDVHVDFHWVQFDQRDPKRVMVGSDGGIYLSGDGGETYRHWNNLPVGQFTTIAVDNKRPYNIYGGTQDNGTLKGPSNYVPGRTDPNAWTFVGGGDGSALAVDPRGDGDVIFYAFQFGAHFGLNQRTGERWFARPAKPDGDPPLRFNWISPLILSPHHPDIVYCGAQRLFRSFNQGRTYTPISPDLTKNRPQGNVPHSTIKDVSESPLRFGLIYAGCDDGNVQMTPDGGRQWVSINTPEPNKWVSRVVASKWDEATVYVAQSGYREDEFNAYLWKSTDYGKTWKSIVANLPAETINVVREDPNVKDVLYVGTDMGVYISFDAGGSWESIQSNLMFTPVHDIAVQARDRELVIASHARSIWVLPLTSILRVTKEIRGKPLHLWAVPDIRWSANWPFNEREPWDVTPPSPAWAPTVRAEFWSGVAGKGTAKLKSKDGTVLKEIELDAVKGLNLLSLDLKLAPAQPSAFDPKRPREVKSAEEALKDPRAAARAKYPEPGEYTLEITVGGVTETVPVKIVREPPRPPQGGSGDS